MAFKLKKVFKKKRIVEFVKGAAIAVAAVYTGGAIYGALGAAGTASLATGGLTLAQRNAQAKAAAANADAARSERDALAIQVMGGMNAPISPGYSAPFNPGYSYTGSPSAYDMGAGGGVYGGGGAAVPEQQSGGGSFAPGFTFSPMVIVIGLALLLGGFLLLRR